MELTLTKEQRERFDAIDVDANFGGEMEQYDHLEFGDWLALDTEDADV